VCKASHDKAGSRNWGLVEEEIGWLLQESDGMDKIIFGLRDCVDQENPAPAVEVAFEVEYNLSIELLLLPKDLKAEPILRQ
jgi:hypothetical protein